MPAAATCMAKPFVSASHPAFALPCQLLPGETWWGACATVPTQVHTLTRIVKRDHQALTQP